MNDYYDEFSDTIGELLGINLALAEEDLREGRNADEAMQSIKRIAQTYEAFCSGALIGFKEDFDKGYHLGKRDVRTRYGPNESLSAKGPIGPEI